MKKRSPSTIANRRCTVGIMAKHATADGLTDPDQVDKTWLADYLLHQGEGREGNGFTALWESLRAFWRWWAEDDDGRVSPMARIARPKTVVTTVEVLTRDQIEAIIKVCDGRGFEELRNKAIVLLLFESGLRRFELAALTLEDVDLDEMTVTVRHGKGDKPRVTVAGPDTMQAILRYLRARENRAHARQQALFVSRYGKKMTPGGIGQIITRIGEAAGVEGLHPHQFRHSWTHYLLESGQVQEHEIMTLAGWSTTKQLSRYGAARAQDRAIAAGLRTPVMGVLRKLDQAGGLAVLTAARRSPYR
jgi:site-specific recombinase XerD